VVVVVVLTVLSGGCVVVVVGADVRDAAGSLVVGRNVVTPGNDGLPRTVSGEEPAALGSVPVPVLVCVGGRSEPLDDVVEVADGATVSGDAVGMPEGGAVSPVLGGVVDPLAMAGRGPVGDKRGASARDERITTMPKADAVPMPFCRRLRFISNLNHLIDRPLRTQAPTSVDVLYPCMPVLHALQSIARLGHPHA
jgi:hypothetical protein